MCARGILKVLGGGGKVMRGRLGAAAGLGTASRAGGTGGGSGQTWRQSEEADRGRLEGRCGEGGGVGRVAGGRGGSVANATVVTRARVPKAAPLPAGGTRATTKASSASKSAGAGAPPLWAAPVTATATAVPAAPAGTGSQAEVGRSQSECTVGGRCDGAPGWAPDWSAATSGRVKPRASRWLARAGSRAVT